MYFQAIGEEISRLQYAIELFTAAATRCGKPNLGILRVSCLIHNSTLNLWHLLKGDFRGIASRS